MARVLVTGATGYIGGRLIPELLDRGHDVVCLARSPEKLQQRDWRDQVSVIAGDAGDRQRMVEQLEDIDHAYFLVHSMDGGSGFHERDRRIAEAFRDAAADAGVKRIIYLGGLGRADDDLSPHLASRHEVGRVLADGPVPVTELRAAMIVGSGSASFEMLRNLVEVLPVMVTPGWVRHRCQPIAIRDILYYLVHVLDVEETTGQVLEVGGPDVVTYGELMQLFADVAGLPPRLMIPVPALTPKLSSYWVGFVTPIPVGLAKPLVESLQNEVIVTDDRIRHLVPRDALPIRTALELAIRRVQDLDVTTSWSQAEHRDDRTAEPWPEDPEWAGGTVLADERVVRTSASPDDLFAAVQRIGGEVGYYAFDALWEVRGALDALVGGIGLRRGRRHPEQLAVGESLDFWRVQQFDPPRRLRLHAEMRLPGEAWLDFEVRPEGAGTSGGGGAVLVQRARFTPRGLWGRGYWYALWPFHQLIFPQMARRIAEYAERS